MKPRARRRFRWRVSLRARIVGCIAIVVVLIALFVRLYVPGLLRQHALEEIEAKARSIAAITAYGARVGMEFDDITSLREVLEPLRQDAGVAWAAINDTTGRTLTLIRGASSFGTTNNGSVPALSDAISVTAPVMHQSRIIGRVELGLALEPVHERVSRARTQITVASAFIVAIGLTLVYGVGTVLLAPIRRMVATAERVSRGDLTQRTRVRTSDELGYLGRAFDHMVARLQQTQNRLQAANRRLESRVAARTADLQREVEERRRADEALRESEHQFRTMVDSAAMGVMLVDEDGRILEANPALSAMLGVPRDRILSTQVGELIHTDEDEPWLGHRAIVSGATEQLSQDVRIGTGDGRLLWGRAVASAVRDRDRRLRFAIVMIENTTERRELESQLLQSQKLEAVGRLAGGIAHDFNNLLTTINGLTSLVLDDLDNLESARSDLEEIRSAGERAATLTGQLLAFSRKQVVQVTLLDLNAIIRDTAGMLRRMIGEDIALNLDLAEELPAIRADQGHVTQILMNLVVNARDAMPTGGTIRISTRETHVDDGRHARLGTAAAGSHVRIDVADSGSGIDPQVLARIFEPFFTTKPVGKGTGLGLATVYGVVKQAGGGIDVATVLGHGTTFSIFLPATLTGLGPASRLSDVDVEPLAEGRGETILVVEDEHAVRSLVARVLRSRRFLVLEASSGPDAISAAAAHAGDIDVVLTDVIMPDMSGPDLVKHLVAERPGLRVIYMSGYTQDEVLHHGVSQDEVCFLEKPMSPAAILAKVRAVLDRRGAPLDEMSLSAMGD